MRNRRKGKGRGADVSTHSFHILSSSDDLNSPAQNIILGIRNLVRQFRLLSSRKRNILFILFIFINDIFRFSRLFAIPVRMSGTGADLGERLFTLFGG